MKIEEPKKYLIFNLTKNEKIKNTENNINKLDFNESIPDIKEEQEKINSVALRMKIDSQNNLDLQIKKDSKNIKAKKF